MIALVFEFDGVALDTTRDLFDQLPQALAGRSVRVDYRPVQSPAGAPALQALATHPPPGRWACGQVLHGAVLPAGAGVLPLATGAVPAIVWDGQRFDGPGAINRLLAALPPA